MELLAFVGANCIDAYEAIEEASGEAVLIILHEDIPPKISFLSDLRIVYKQPARLLCCDEIKRWEKFSKESPAELLNLITVFMKSYTVKDLLSRNDVLAIYPSTKQQSGSPSIIPAIRVIVKALGYFPRHSDPLPTTIDIDGILFPVEVDEGSITLHAGPKSGDGIGCSNSLSGFGTLAGVVQNDDGEYFAVTNEHVVKGSMNRQLNVVESPSLSSPTSA